MKPDIALGKLLPWVAAYPPGVEATINADQHASVSTLMLEACAKYEGKVSFSCMGKSLTFAQLQKDALQLAAYLQQELRLEKGDRVAVMMPNLLQYPVAVMGILCAGLVVVNVNPLYTPRELEHQLRDSGAKAIIILENFAGTLEKVIDKTDIQKVISTQIGDWLDFPKSILTNVVVKYQKKLVPPWHLPNPITMKVAVKLGASRQLQPVAIEGNDIAFLQYTGGTTGVSKGAMLTNRNLIANMLQMRAWMSGVVKEREEVVIQPLPLYHIFALSSSLIYLDQGCETVLVPNPRDQGALISLLRDRRWTIFTGVNTLFNSLINNADFAKLDFSAVKLCIGGGMAVQQAVAEKWKKITGQAIVEAYGLTETSPAAVANRLDIKDYTGSIGLPIPSTEVTIRDDDGNVLPFGERGEICIKGPQVMKGYWQRPDETAKVMTQDGAFKTGDIGIMDDKGYIKIVDRKKDMILVSGFNVYPNEIEDVVVTCPGVLEVCAVAAPDPKSGEVVRVVVVKKDPTLTREAVMEHCRQHLTGYKLPKIIEFWDELPKTNVGKVLRRSVRDAPPKNESVRLS